MTDRRAIVVFTEGSFEKTFTRPTLAEARAFADGVGVGASYYGAGSCHAYVLPEDSGEMAESAASKYSDLMHEEVAIALAAAEKALQEATF